MKLCARCEKRLPDREHRLYSSWTRLYYCAEVNACAKRAAKLKRKVAV